MNFKLILKKGGNLMTFWENLLNKLKYLIVSKEQKELLDSLKVRRYGLGNNAF